MVAVIRPATLQVTGVLLSVRDISREAQDDLLRGTQLVV